MDIEQSTLVARNERRRQHTHEAGKKDQTRQERVDGVGERGIEGVASGELPVLNYPRRDAARGCGVKAFRVRSAADDRGNRQASPKQSLEVAAATRNEDDDQNTPVAR